MAKKTAQSVSAPESTPIAASSMPVRRWQENESAGETDEQTAGLMFANTNGGGMMDNVTRSLETAPPSPSSLEIPLQTKLTLGEVGDRYEQEADRVASETVNILHRKPDISRMGEKDTNNTESANHVIQRSPQVQTFREVHSLVQRDGEGEGVVSNDIERNINSMRGVGSALPGRDRFEKAMEADFSNVRVHHNSQSDQLNRQLSSRAFTTGSDIFFKSGELNPGTPRGDELLSHELTHVKQQNPSINLKPTEESIKSRVSRAVDGVIQRETLLQEYEYAIDDETSMKGTTFKIVKELLKKFSDNQGEPFRYLYLQKVYRLLTYKLERGTIKSSPDMGGNPKADIRDFVERKLKPLAERERAIFEVWMEDKASSQDDSDGSLAEARNHHIKLKNFLKSNSEELPDSDLDKRYSDFLSSSRGKTGLAGLANYFKENKKGGKGFTITKVDLDALDQAADQGTIDLIKHFRKKTYKGFLRQRGELFNATEHFLARAITHIKEAKEAKTNRDADNGAAMKASGQKAVALLNMGRDMLDIWLLKYGRKVNKAKGKVMDAQANLEAASQDKKNEAEAAAQKAKDKQKKAEEDFRAYPYVQRFRDGINKAVQDHAKAFEVLAEDKIATDASKIVLPDLGQAGADDRTALAQLDYEHVIKKYGNKYSGDCGFFFGTFYPSILNMLAPNVGMKSKFEADVLFEVPGPCPPLGFHLKIDVERKDANELKNWTDIEFTTGIQWGTGKATVGAGMYFEFTANTAQKVGQLFSYTMYRRFRESRIVPAFMTNALWGGAGTDQGRFNAEAWAIGVEEKVFAGAGKAEQKAYAEGGFIGRAAIENAAGKNAVKVDVLAGMGKRYSQETLVATGAMSAIDKNGREIKYPTNKDEFQYSAIASTNDATTEQKKGIKGVQDALDGYKTKYGSDKNVHDVKWKHPYLKYIENREKAIKKDKDNAKQLTPLEKEIKGYVEANYKIVKFANSDTYQGTKPGAFKAERQKGFDTGRAEVNGRFQMGDFAAGAKVKLEFVGGDRALVFGADKGSNVQERPRRVLRKVETEIKVKVFGTLSQMVTNFLAPTTGVVLLGEKIAAWWRDSENKKARKQESKDKGKASRIFGEIMATSAAGLTGFGSYLNEGARDNATLSAIGFGVESGAQFRMKMATEAKNLLQQKKGSVIDKGKGEAHIELIAGLGLGMDSSVTKDIGVEIAKRLISLKWEGKNKWAGIPLAHAFKKVRKDAAWKRVELGMGLYDKKRKRPKDEPVSDEQRAKIQGTLLKSGVALLAKLSSACGQLPEWADASTEEKAQTWQRAVEMQANKIIISDLKEKTIAKDIPGDKWRDAFAKGIGGYGKVYKNNPIKYFTQGEQLDNGLIKDMLVTGMGGAQGWGNIYRELFSDETKTPNLVKYYAGKTEKKDGYSKGDAKTEADVIHKLLLKFLESMNNYKPIFVNLNFSGDDDGMVPADDVNLANANEEIVHDDSDLGAKIEEAIGDAPILNVGQNELLGGKGAKEPDSPKDLPRPVSSRALVPYQSVDDFVEDIVLKEMLASTESLRKVVMIAFNTTHELLVKTVKTVVVSGAKVECNSAIASKAPVYGNVIIGFINEFDDEETVDSNLSARRFLTNVLASDETLKQFYDDLQSKDISQMTLVQLKQADAAIERFYNELESAANEVTTQLPLILKQKELEEAQKDLANAIIKEIGNVKSSKQTYKKHQSKTQEVYKKYKKQQKEKRKRQKEMKARDSIFLDNQ
ncbi:MAG: DUF4157 domain-containing protein [Cyanobacteria bacterium P01_E01_bin.42]